MTEPVPRPSEQGPMRPTVDNTDGFHNDLTPSGSCRPRSINLIFRQHEGSYEVTAFGQAFPDDGDGVYTGRLNRTSAEVDRAIGLIFKRWRQYVIDLARETNGRTRPYEDVPDTTDEAAARLWQTTGRKLAQAGDSLFRTLFRSGDDGLTEIADRLCAALRDGEQIISIHSDILFAPWSMLYTPKDPTANMRRNDVPWEPDGFWGYRHLVEHCVRRVRNYRAEIVLTDLPPLISMYVDPGLDDQYHEFSFVQSVTEFFGERAQILTRTRKEDLAEDIAAGGHGEHVMYFGCHGSDGRVGSPAPRGSRAAADYPALVLADADDPVQVEDLVNWFDEFPMTSGPVVYLAACEAGRIGTSAYSSFGKAFVEGGANCLVGPQIDLFVRFAREYTCRFFERFLEPGNRIGDITRQLARDFIDYHHTPLGLIFTLHRGLDTHLVRPPPDIQPAE